MPTRFQFSCPVCRMRSDIGSILACVFDDPAVDLLEAKASRQPAGLTRQSCLIATTSGRGGNARQPARQDDHASASQVAGAESTSTTMSRWSRHAESWKGRRFGSKRAERPGQQPGGQAAKASGARAMRMAGGASWTCSGFGLELASAKKTIQTIR